MNNKGFTLLEIVAVISIMFLIGAVAVPSFFGYQRNAERSLHIMNANQMMSAVENGILEEWVTKPNTSQTTEVTIAEVASQNVYLNFSDPSSQTDSQYDLTTSMIQVYNKDSRLEFYIKLVEETSGHVYVDTTAAPNTQGSKEVKLIVKTDIDLTSD